MAPSASASSCQRLRQPVHWGTVLRQSYAASLLGGRLIGRLPLGAVPVALLAMARADSLLDHRCPGRTGGQLGMSAGCGWISRLGASVSVSSLASSTSCRREGLDAPPLPPAPLVCSPGRSPSHVGDSSLAERSSERLWRTWFLRISSIAGREYRLSELDQHRAPAAISKSRDRFCCGRSPATSRPPLQRVHVIDMHQGTRALPRAHSTPPWCQQRASASWPCGGTFVLSQTSRTPEGAVMT